jgi:hypothetical protein
VVIDRCFVFNLRYNLAAALVPPCHLSNDTDHGTGAVPFKAVDMNDAEEYCSEGEYKRKLKEWERKGKSLKAMLFRYIESRCEECGRTEDLTADHIVPLRRSGANTFHNLRILCRSCNSRKGAKIINY